MKPQVLTAIFLKEENLGEVIAVAVIGGTR